jgi:hypothetical protein
VANLSRKALVRLLAVHKPFVRMSRRRARAAERDAILAAALDAEGEIAAAVAGDGPIVVGPWLGEVGYEALYWVPFVRWVQDRQRIDPDRLIVMSRGGVEEWYRSIGGRYVDLFDLLSPEELALRNDARQTMHERGGRKQSRRSELDEWLLQRANGQRPAAVLHPSLMFRMFRDVWLGNLPLDFLLTRADFGRVPRPPRPAVAGLPADYVAVKLYTGTALPDTAANLDAMRSLVRRVAQRTPVVVLDTGLAVDDHRDFTFDDIPGVISARQWMTPRTNLGLQSSLIAHATYFLGTCGGLAWLAPFMGVPTVAVYADDAFLRLHMAIARQAGTQAGAAEFTPLDIRALTRLALCP